MPTPVAGPAARAGSRHLIAQADPITEWFDDNSSALISGVLNIVIIIVVALLLRAILGRVIDQLARRMVSSRERLTKARPSRIVKSAGTARAERQRQRQRQRAQTIASVLKSVATLVVFGIAFVTILSQVGINIGPILASAGVVGLAIGFGAQSVVQDFLSGLFMMTEDQYGVGDVIDAGDAVGTVEAVTLRITKIRDLNGGLWHVRNGEIQRVCDMNQDWANAVVELPLDYSVDVANAKQVIQHSIDEFADDPEVAPKIIKRPDIAGSWVSATAR
ncbi:mechanosensitive ion channel family protein [Qaidamihabitans albus]|uniref:mechanosensitive ion channel family protein n=1 Tax=Qaidamihabitans albus TaxID=2795733 RepID=UPI0018F276C7|nr:mechanosensitive ion channel domain-containing protein [Qaidamihabitans albus]